MSDTSAVDETPITPEDWATYVRVKDRIDREARRVAHHTAIGRGDYEVVTDIDNPEGSIVTAYGSTPFIELAEELGWTRTVNPDGTETWRS